MLRIDATADGLVTKRCVLVVEGGSPLGRRLAGALQRHFEVLQAEGYADAVDLFEGTPRIGAVVTDLHYAASDERNGVDLLWWVSKRPAIGRILVSADFTTANVRLWPGTEIAHVRVFEPVQPRALRKAIGSTLRPRSS